MRQRAHEQRLVSVSHRCSPVAPGSLSLSVHAGICSDGLFQKPKPALVSHGRLQGTWTKILARGKLKYASTANDA